MDDCQDILSKCISEYPELSILVLAYEFPRAFESHKGRIAFIGGEPPSRGFKSKDFHFMWTGNSEAIASAIASLSQAGEVSKFDVIFFDHHHALSSLIDQINASLSVAHSDSVFIFDDAVPPDIAFCGPTPTQGWWVGEVWMLPNVLGECRSNSKQWIINLPPTGMCIALGLERIDSARAGIAYQQMLLVRTTADILAILRPFEDESFSGQLKMALAYATKRKFIPITPSTSSIGAEETTIIDEAMSWERPPLLFLLDLSERNLNLSSLSNSHRRIHAKVLDRFSDVILTGFDGFVKDATFYSRTIGFTESVARRHLREPKYSRTILQLNENEIVLPKSHLDALIELDESVFFGTPDEPDNYGMWILYGVPSVHHFLADAARYACYFTYVGHPWQRRLLAHLGVTKQLKEHRLDHTYRCASLALIRHDVRNLTVSSSDRTIFRAAAERFKSKSSPFGERIFVSRLSQSRRNGGYRGLVNEAALIDALSERRFDVIEPETLEFPDQVRAFAGAKVIVGLGGAGMFNAVFAAPDTTIIAIEGSTEWVDSHVNLFSSCGLRCGVIIGQQDLTDAEPVHKRWSLDVAAAMRQIDKSIGDSK